MSQNRNGKTDKEARRLSALIRKLTYKSSINSDQAKNIIARYPDLKTDRDVNRVKSNKEAYLL